MPIIAGTGGSERHSVMQYPRLEASRGVPQIVTARAGSSREDANRWDSECPERSTGYQSIRCGAARSVAYVSSVAFAPVISVGRKPAGLPRPEDGHVYRHYVKCTAVAGLKMGSKSAHRMRPKSPEMNPRAIVWAVSAKRPVDGADAGCSGRKSRPTARVVAKSFVFGT